MTHNPRPATQKLAKGFEPITYCLQGSRSTRLSYASEIDTTDPTVGQTKIVLSGDRLLLMDELCVKQ